MSLTKITPKSKDKKLIIAIDNAESKIAASYNETGTEAISLRINGKLATPNVLFKEGDSIFIGDRALNRAPTAPEKLVSSFKRPIKTAPDVEIGQSGLTPRDCLRAVIELVMEATRKVSPTLAQAIDSGNFHGCMTVPGWFTEPEKKIYASVASEVGFNLLSMPTEPIAALVHVRSQHSGRMKNGDIIGVVDIGAATSDFELMEYLDGKFNQVVAGVGIDIGGEDFTGAVFLHLCEKYGYGELSKCFTLREGFNFAKSDLTTSQKLTGIKLRKAAESLKIDLSSFGSAETYVEIPDVGTLPFNIDLATAMALWKPLFDEISGTLEQFVSSAPKMPNLLVAVGGGALVPDLADTTALAATLPVDAVLKIADSVNVIPNGAVELVATESLGGTVLGRAIGVAAKDPDTNEEVAIVLAEEGQSVPRNGHRVEDDKYFITPKAGKAVIDVQWLEVHPGIRPLKKNGRLMVPIANTSPLGRGWAEFAGLPNKRQQIALQFCCQNKNPEFAIRPVDSNVEPQRVSVLKDDVCPTAAAELHLTILLDVSTSMRRDFDGLKAGLCSLIPELLKEGVTISLVAFGGKVKTLSEHSTSEEELCGALENLDVSGSTNMAAALRRATKLIRPSVQNIVFLYTDGMPNSATESMEAATILKQDVDKVATFGIGPLADHDLLRTQIASSSDDHFEGLTSEIPLAISSVVDLYLLETQATQKEVIA